MKAPKRPAELPPGRVLVVGAANSGCQIALELSASHAVELSVGRRIPTIPERPVGRDVWSWATGIRLDRVTADSRLGRRLSKRDQIIGAGPRQLVTRMGAVMCSELPENATLVTELLVDLRERGLDVTRPVLAVLEGSKALRRAVLDVFDHPVLSRCGQMAMRWCAAGMIEARRQFRRVNGHLHLPTLRAALERETATTPADTCQDEEVSAA